MHRFQPGNDNPILNDKLLREAYEAGRRDALNEQVGMMPTSGMGGMAPTSSVGGMGKATNAVNLSMDRTPNTSGLPATQTKAPPGASGSGGAWYWDNRGYYYKEYRGTYPNGQFWYYYDGRWWTTPPPVQVP